MANPKKGKLVSKEELVTKPRLYVGHWLNFHNVTIDARGIPCDSRGRNQNTIFKSMWLDYQEEKRDINKQRSNSGQRALKGFSENDLKKAFDELADDTKIEARKKMIENLKCNCEDLTELSNFVTGLLGSPNPLVEAVFAHFAWQVKRKMLGLHLHDHLMPVVNGPQGVGKTEAIKKFVAPVEPCVLRARINDLIDPRFGLSLEQHFIGVFDEMQGASRADIDGLKNQITQDYNSTRILGTNDVVRVKQNCTLIGTTNKPVSEQIFDVTGMRRFFEIKTADKIDWKTINSIDYQKLWQGVDENKSDGYLKPVLLQIRAIQSELTATDDIAEFLEEAGISLPKADYEDLPCDQVFEQYKTWAISCATKVLTRQMFGRRLKHKGFESSPITRHGRTKRYYRVAKLVTGLAVVYPPFKIENES